MSGYTTHYDTTQVRVIDCFKNTCIYDVLVNFKIHWAVTLLQLVRLINGQYLRVYYNVIYMHNWGHIPVHRNVNIGVDRYC